MIGSEPVIDAEHATQQKNQRVHLEIRRNPGMVRRVALQRVQNAGFHSLRLTPREQSDPKPLRRAPNRAAIFAVFLDSPRGIGDSSQGREFLGGSPERAEQNEGAALAVLVLFEPVESQTGRVAKRHVHADHSLERLGGFRGGGEEDVGGAVEFRGGASKSVAEVDGVESRELGEPVEETAASAARRDGVDVDTAVLEGGEQRVGEQGRVERTREIFRLEKGVRVQGGEPATRFRLVLGETLAEPLLVEGGKLLLHQPLLIGHRVEKTDRVLVLLATTVSGG